MGKKSPIDISCKATLRKKTLIESFPPLHFHSTNKAFGPDKQGSRKAKVESARGAMAKNGPTMLAVPV